MIGFDPAPTEQTAVPPNAVLPYLKPPRCNAKEYYVERDCPEYLWPRTASRSLKRSTNCDERETHQKYPPCWMGAAIQENPASRLSSVQPLCHESREGSSP